MKNINAAVRSNGKLAQVLATRRDNGFHAGTIKRQSRRQMRQRLETDLRQEVSSFLVHENRHRMIQAWFANEWKEREVFVAQQAAVSPNAGARVVREVQITSKVTVTPFARKQVKVAVLAV